MAFRKLFTGDSVRFIITLQRHSAINCEYNLIETYNADIYDFQKIYNVTERCLFSIYVAPK